MAKKLIKLSPGRLIKDFKIWNSHYLHFVLKDRSVRLLKPTKLEGKKIHTKTTKHHSIIINLSTIEEIWTETVYTVDK
ncbi:MAG: hypothetical protein ACO2ZZ_03655 [Cyclobacteriaceae bacterium]